MVYKKHHYLYRDSTYVPYWFTCPTQLCHSRIDVMLHHCHLGFDVLFLLLHVQGTIVPLQVADGRVESVYIVGATYP